MAERIPEQEMAEELTAIVASELEPDGFKVRDVRSFEDAGIVTRHPGFVVQLNDGSEYQITVVRSQ